MPQPFHLCPDLTELYTHERLNYVLGQVLGVKDFQQEQLYFLHKARLHNRSLHGYGTVWGLEVSRNGTGEALEIQVVPGLAIDTQGREVLVDALQCARINTWLAAAVSEGAATTNRDTLNPVAPANPNLAVYVTLCYYPCPTGAQPILGEPCRADSGKEGVIQNTRIRDEFELKLLPAPPRQLEEDQVRAIGDLLAKMQLDASAPSDTTALVQTLRNALDDPARISGLGALLIPPDQAEDILRELLRYWVTQTRPTLDQLHNPVLQLLKKITIDEIVVVSEEAIVAQIAAFRAALDNYVATKTLAAIDALPPVTAPSPVTIRYRRAILQHWSSKPDASKTTEDDCILLAAVQFTPAADGTVDEATLKIENLQRPYLLHTRLLQELLLQRLLQSVGGTGPEGPPGTAATITVNPDVTMGEPGTPARVTTSGDTTNAVFNFTIPRGQQGIQGIQGLQGNPGLGLDQLIIRPTDLVTFQEQNGEQLVQPLTMFRGAPALPLTERQLIALSTLKPSSLQPGSQLLLRLYCANTGDPNPINWLLENAWGTNFAVERNDTVDIRQDFPVFNNSLQAWFSVAEATVGAFEGKQNSLVINLKHSATAKQLLLMAEFRWEV